MSSVAPGCCDREACLEPWSAGCAGHSGGPGQPGSLGCFLLWVCTWPAPFGSSCKCVRPRGTSRSLPLCSRGLGPELGRSGRPGAAAVGGGPAPHRPAGALARCATPAPPPLTCDARTVRTAPFSRVVGVRRERVQPCVTAPGTATLTVGRCLPARRGAAADSASDLRVG